MNSFSYDLQDRIMSWIILLICIGVVFVIGYAVINETHVRNMTMVDNVKTVVVGINGNDITNVGKSQVPTVTNTVMFKIVEGPYRNQHFKLHSSGYDTYGITTFLTDSWVYNHAIGDTVVFKTVSNIRFFTVRDP